MREHQLAAVQMVGGQHLLGARRGEVLEDHRIVGDKLEPAVSLTSRARDLPVASQPFQSREGRLGIDCSPPAVRARPSESGGGNEQTRNGKYTMDLHRFSLPGKTQGLSRPSKERRPKGTESTGGLRKILGSSNSRKFYNRQYP